MADDDLAQELVDPETLDPETAFDPPVPTDPADLRALMFERLQDRIPGWEPHRTSPLVQLVSVVAEVQAEALQAWASDLRQRLLELIAERFGIARHLGAPARTTITVRARDLLGHELPAGTSVHIGDVDLETVTALVIPAGLDTGTVEVQTIEPGAAANGVSGPVEIDALDWLHSEEPVTLDAQLAGGVDPETDAAYAARVAEELRLLTRTPILPGDFVTAARRHPRVGHAWALNLHNPDDPTRPEGHARHVTIVVTDPDGQPLTPADHAEIAAEIAATREVTMQIHVISPRLVPVDVDATVSLHPGWRPEIVCAVARDRLTQAVSPRMWLLAPYGDDPSWVPTRRVHPNELIAQLDQVHGVDVVETLTVDGGTTPVPLGPLELPTPGTITVTDA